MGYGRTLRLLTLNFRVTVATTRPTLNNCSGHTAAVLDGKKIAGQWQAELEAQVADVTRSLGRPPGLGVVLVGGRPDSRLYVQRKQEACVKVHTTP